MRNPTPTPAPAREWIAVAPIVELGVDPGDTIVESLDGSFELRRPLGPEAGYAVNYFRVRLLPIQAADGAS